MEANNCQYGDDACGTHSGYIRRIRKKLPTCEICRVDHAQYVRVRRYIKKYNQEGNTENGR